MARVEGTITVELPADDWIWLCELLAEIRANIDMTAMTVDDVEHTLNTLAAFEQGV